MPPPDPTRIRKALAADASALRAILYDTFERTWLPNITPLAAEAFRDEDRPSVYAAERLETDTFNLRSQAFCRARRYVEADRYPDTEWNSGLTTVLLVKALIL